MIEKKVNTVLGLDYGTKRIGLAVGQTITNSASPLCTVNQLNGAPDWEGIKTQIDQWAPDCLVVGIPYHTDGTESEMTKKALQFSEQLKKKFSLPVHHIDETLSSYSAEEFLKKNTKIGKHNKHEVDKIAAAIIVQNWLDQN